MTTSRPHVRAAPGFTLVEMLVALAVSAVVIAGGITLLLSQQRMFERSSGVRALQDTARVALGDLAANLRRAGYGVDPALALDFGRTSSVRQKQAVPSGPPGNSGYLCPSPVSCRDRTDGPDEIVFYERDPDFGYTVSGVTASSVTLAGPLRSDVHPGQVLQLMCLTGEMYWAYVTASSVATAGSSSISLAGASGLDFPSQNGSLVDVNFPTDCFNDGRAWLAKVDRYRYYVQNFDPAGGAAAATAPGARPFLMLDRGLSDQAPILVAPDVEDVQFAYLFPRQPAATQLVGASPSVPIANSAEGIQVTAASSGYGVADDDPSRSTWHPSNIRAVRVSVVVRTPTRDDKVADAIVPAAANRPDIDGPAGYRRVRFETTIFLPNLDARMPYFPVNGSPARGANAGGS